MQKSYTNQRRNFGIGRSAYRDSTGKLYYTYQKLADANPIWATLLGERPPEPRYVTVSRAVDELNAVEAELAVREHKRIGTRWFRPQYWFSKLRHLLYGHSAAATRVYKGHPTCCTNW